MNKRNIWFHLIIAISLISVAAIIGQIRKWSNSNDDFIPLTASKTQPKPKTVTRKTVQNEPEVFVKFKPEVSSEVIKKLTSKNNDRIEDRIESVKGLTSIDDLDDKTGAELAEQYSKMTDLVLYAEAVEKIELNPIESFEADNLFARDTGFPNDPMFNDQWALSNVGQNNGKAKADISATEAWKKTKGNRKIVVAVLDTGVDYKHEDLATNMWTRPDNVPQYKDSELGTVNDLHGFDADVNLQDPMDDNGHGTHCAGVIGAEGDNREGIAGINWDIEIMPLKFLSRGGFGTTKNAIEAINYVIERKRAGVNVRIVSNSWGSTSKSKALEDVIRAAGEEGILFIAAAGNDGTNNDKRPHYPSNYQLPNMISVAATDRNDQIASFSNFGLKTVHIAAPGKDITSTWINGSYREISGTSMATPQVSGVAALILANDPGMKLDKLREKLLKSVDKIEGLSEKVESGGRINAAKAVN
jgi:subtilisin family serine protease